MRAGTTAQAPVSDVVIQSQSGRILKNTVTDVFV